MPGLVIGKVAIKVLPDTDGFREKVKRDLNGKEKPGQIEIKVIPKLDDSAFRDIQRKLEGLGDVDVQVSPELDRAGLREVQLSLEGIEQVDVDVNPSMDWSMYQRAMEALEELSEPQLVEVGVWARMTSFRATAARLTALTRPRVVQIKTALDEPQVQKTAKLLGDAFGRLSGLRFTLDQFAKFREEMLNLDKLIPKIGFLSHGLGSLSAIALTAGGSLLSVSAGLVQMGAAGLALPGLIGGIATGLAITAIALADFKKEVPQITSAWGDLRSAISQNFWDVAGDGIRSLVDELFPLLTREAGKTATALGGFFSNLSKSLQGKLLPVMSEMFDNLNKSIDIFSKRTDAVANIIATLGKLGSKYLPALADGFGDLTQNFSDWLTVADEAGKLTEWVDAGIDQLKNFGRAVGATASIFWSLTQAAQAAGGETLGGVADALERIATAASSPGFQRGLTDTLSAAYNMMDQISSRVGPPLANLIESLSETFQDMAPVMGDTVATAVTAIANALSSPSLQRGLKQLLSGFNRMVNELAPAMQPLADKLGALGGVVGELAEAVGKVLGAAIEAVSPLFVALADAIKPVIDGLGELVSGAIDDLAPVFSDLAKIIEEQVAPLMPDLIKAFQDFYDAIAPTLIPALEDLVGFLGDSGSLTSGIQGTIFVLGLLVDAFELVKTNFEIFKAAIGAVPAVFEAVYNGVVAFVTQIVTKLASAWTSVQTTVTAKWSAIKASISTRASEIRTAVVNAIENLRANLAAKWESVRANAVAKIESLKSSVTGAISSMKASVVSRVEELRASIAGKWESIRSSAASKWESIRSTVSDAAGRLRSAVSEKVDQVVAYMRGVPGRIVGALGSLGSLLYSAGSSLIQGLIDGIQSKIGAVQSKLSDLTSLLPSWKGPPQRDKVLLTPAGELIMQSLIDGFENKFDAVRKALTGLTDDIVDTLGTDVAMSVSADAAVTTASMARQITAATRANAAASSTPASTEPAITIGNITIPLEDLKQLKDLEEFMELLRVRTRMG